VAEAGDAHVGVPSWWPHAAHSRFVPVGALRWHVQRWSAHAPGAPVALLLHGTGAGTHTWRHLAPLLAQRFDVIAPDLPGHAFTGTPRQQPLTLPAVAQAVGALLGALQVRPALVVGHSAGAAVAMRMVLDGQIAPALTVSINGALLPLQGPVGRLFLPLARLLAGNPLVPPVFAAWASLPSMARRLLEGTGSRIDSVGERAYAHLVANAAHASGALRLMASWDLQPLAAALADWKAPLLLIAAAGDRTVPPLESQRVHERVRARTGDASRCVVLQRGGHLVHEEDAPAVFAALWDAWQQAAPAAAAARPRQAPAAAAATSSA
jgi:magnesium chelatase accessory protein